MTKKNFMAFFAILGVLTLSDIAWGLSLEYTEGLSGSNFTYDFMLVNDDVAGGIYELYIETPVAESSILSFSSPSGWGDGWGGDQPAYGAIDSSNSFIEWFADWGADLLLGETLGGFSFVSSDQINLPISFSVNYDTSLGGTAVAASSAAPVPEPTTLLLLGTGIAGFAGFRKKFIRK